MDTSPPSARDSGLAGLHALEWRHDGPLPPEALDALTVSEAGMRRRRAAADGALIDRLALDAVRGRAACRAAGAVTGVMPGAAADRALAAALAAGREAGLALYLEGDGVA